MFARSEFEALVQSKELLTEYVQKELPYHEIKYIPGDGLCILRSFKENMEKVSKITVTMKEVMKCLRSELLCRYEFYKNFCADPCNILEDLDNFLEDPLKFYNCESGNIFLMALGNAFKVNTVILQSDANRCWTTDFSNGTTQGKCKFYFARSLSLHYDIIVPHIDDFSSDFDISDEVPVHDTGTSHDKPIKQKNENENSSDHTDSSDVVFVSFVPVEKLLPTEQIKFEKGDNTGILAILLLWILCVLISALWAGKSLKLGRVSSSFILGKIV